MHLMLIIQNLSSYNWFICFNISSKSSLSNKWGYFFVVKIIYKIIVSSFYYSTLINLQSIFNRNLIDFLNKELYP